MARVPGSAASVGAALVRMFPLLSALTSLHLAHCALGAENGAAIICAVPSLRQLAELDLSDNELGKQVMAAFGHWPAQPLELTALSLARNAIGVRALSELRSVLLHTPRLQRLDTSGNVLMSDVDSMVYGESETLNLQPPLRLRELRVSCTDVFGQVFDQTFHSQASSLRILRVESCQHDAAVTSVAWTQLQFAEMQELKLACSVRFPEGMLAQPMKALTSLTLQPEL